MRQLLSNKGCYHGVRVIPHFHKYDVFDRKEEQAELDPDTEEEEMEGVP